MKVQMFHAACKSVLQHAPDDYAKAYAQVGLQLQTVAQIKDQLPYILSNLRTWKGEQAKQVKVILRKM